MKLRYKIFLTMTAFVIVITSLGITSTVQSTVVTAQDKALVFTEKALPIDVSKYNVTLEGYYTSKPPIFNGIESKDFVRENVRYSLVSDTSELEVRYVIENNILTTCIVNVKKGSVKTDRPYNTLGDAVIGLLEKYQTYKGEDTLEMRYMYSSIDSTKNQTVLLGDLKLKITNGDYPFSGHKTSLMWYRVINGCEYLELSLGFTDGVFSSLRDVREITPIGDTIVNITKEQAIAIAMKYIENYTYEMPGNVWITDFKVVENRTIAVLSPTVGNSNMLYPAWGIMLNLDHTYPGSVYALHVIVSAASGEVLLCSNQAAGGSSNSTPSSNDEANKVNDQVIVLQPLPTNWSSSPSLEPSLQETNTASSSINTVAMVAVATVTVTIALIALFIKKRSK